MPNLVNIVNKCKSLGVMNVFVSGIAFNQDSHILIKKVNEKIVDMCNKNGKVFIDNGSISNMDLRLEGFQLQERSKCLLANFFFCIRNFLTCTHTTL